MGIEGLNHHPRNERIKRQYLAFLKEAKRQSEASVDAVAKALARFEEDTKHRDFGAFHFEQAVAFKRRLAQQRNARSGQALSKATLHATFGYLKNFFQWLALQPGYKSKLRYSDAEYFNLSEKDSRVATTRRERTPPTLEQVNHVLSTMPAGAETERRNRALVAFTLLTGARDSAIASMKLKHVDLTGGSVYQDAREVHTKFSKTFTTYFFPVGGQARELVEEWVRYLRESKLWGNDDPLFPATLVEVGDLRQFRAVGISRRHWSSAAPVREAFRKAFAAGGLPYFNPHSFRRTLVLLGQTLCQTPEQFKAWSQNLGHEGVLTTFYSYGEVNRSRQAEIIKNLRIPGGGRVSVEANEFAEALIRKLRESGGHITPG